MDVTVETQTAAQTAESVVEALAALAQPTRLAVFRSLVRAGPDGLTAGRISELADVSPSALTFHLKTLSVAGLVTSSKTGRFVTYTADYAAMQSVVAFLTENCCDGGQCSPR